MKKITQEDAEKELEKRTKKVKPTDFEDVLNKKEKLEGKFIHHAPLQKFIEVLKLLFSVVQDYIKKEYREIPIWTISAIVAGLLYVLSPIDLIPDLIFGIGYIDDGLVITACLAMADQDLQKYKIWKDSKKE